MNKPIPSLAMKVPSRRCAIYTRKSTEEGLEQEFNSLDAQRDACAAYILSQMHEGWSLLPDVYDDGGYSGGNMDRPALKQLLADVKAGEVDVIVVYKVDRLTRSLADFAKIVDVLDASDASFVSVTQTFNTTNSMGRLTLNVLLSFAQFEREVTSERIRDKFAASKRKGMWMGGTVPLGYDVRERKLVVNEAEAANVRIIYARYLKIGAMRELAMDLVKRGIRSKVRYPSGNGGGDFTTGSLSQILKNRLYLGEVHHKGEYFPGEHEAIVDRKTWDKVQALINKNKTNNRVKGQAVHCSPLAGMINDGEGRPMTPTHSCKGTRRYRYYVTKPEALGKGPKDGWNIPAGEVEALVKTRLALWFADVPGVVGQLEGQDKIDALVARATRLADQIPALSPPNFRQLLLDLDVRVGIQKHRMSILFSRSRLIDKLGGKDPADSNERVIAISVEASFVRRGVEMKLRYSPKDTEAPPAYDIKLAELIAKAELAYTSLIEDPENVAAESRPHLVRLARLKFLAPDIVTSIIDGRQPPELTARSLMRGKPVPLCWEEQRAQYGFA